MVVSKFRGRPPLMVACLLLISVQAVTKGAAFMFGPILLRDYPMILIALSSNNQYLLLTTGKVDLVPFLVVAIARRAVTDPFFFLLGARYGSVASGWLESTSRASRFATHLTKRIFRRVSWLAVFFFSTDIISVLAGANGMRFRTFLALDLAGTICAVVIVRTAGVTWAEPLSAIVAFSDRNAETITLCLVIATVVVLLVRLLRVFLTREAPSESEPVTISRTLPEAMDSSQSDDGPPDANRRSRA